MIDPGEIYHVLDGEFTFYVVDRAGQVRRVTAAAGDVVPLAGGTPHTIRNETTSDAVAFVVHSPAAVMEGFSRAAAELDAPSMDRVLALAQEHGWSCSASTPAAVRDCGWSRLSIL